MISIVSFGCGLLLVLFLFLFCVLSVKNKITKIKMENNEDIHDKNLMKKWGGTKGSKRKGPKAQVEESKPKE